MHDKFRRRRQAPRSASTRVRHQIALEAARRMFAEIGPRDERGFLGDASESTYYAAKRKAAAVLGHRVRPGDLPSDSEVREQVLALARTRHGPSLASQLETGPDTEQSLARLSDHVDRYTIYRMRLMALESVKQNSKYHPEGDALYHSLQVFELARDAHPYDEEFLLAALLHDVGKAIDQNDHVAAGLDALHGTLTERTEWLIAHHMDALAYREHTLGARASKALEKSEYFDDLMDLRDVDDAGRVPGAPVGTVDHALDYVRHLDSEEYLIDF